MPLAVPKPLREEVVRRRRRGQRLTRIAAELGLRCRTVRGLWQRYRRRGEQGLEPDYARCGRRGPRLARPVYETALARRRAHPRWGAPLIRLERRVRFPQEPLPRERTVSRWVRAAGLQPRRGKRPLAPPRRRGQRPHEGWQIDAKERRRLGDGPGCSQVSVVDEASGATLGTVAFPPLALEASAPPGRAGGPAAGVRAVGAAGAGPRG